jgi:hypothetical protein
MADIPHFAYPFQRGPDGHVMVVEQDTPEHIQGQQYAVVVTPLGFRDDRADFGWPWPEFRLVPLDLSGLADAFARLVPDSNEQIDQWADAASEAIRHVRVRQMVAGSEESA